MSAIDLFNEIVILRDKIDPHMQMDVWVKLFPLLPEPNDVHVNFAMDEFIDFFSNVAVAANNRDISDTTALVSEHAATGGVNTVVGAPASTSNNARAAKSKNIFSVFNRNAGSIRTPSESDSGQWLALRKVCQKTLQYYTLNTTTSSEFKVGDVVSCMLYLSRMPNYKPLYSLLEQAFGDVHECVPNLTADQMYHVTHLLRSLLDLPSSTIDFDNVKLLRSSLHKVMNYPLTRFPRIVIMPSIGLSKDKRCDLEDLILERSDTIARMEPQQYVEGGDSSKIPYCADEDFIHELLKLTNDFNLKRMFYNAANSMFYTTMENYAIANCKFDIEDYNNIFKSMDEFKHLSEKCGVTYKTPELTDSLNIYLGGGPTPKRKKY
ncbi:p40 [Orgyia leucostigma nucleopolyhedrovirus]|uniref:p40 n=1 Tax=Orgyia leucostigma nucleopolyhedrovirus TaxID=490711 RepID=B0FDV6_9ABAC|nr:p40 [Orgyia leucostigma nucleopolyhedrovirus]ABY65814.1 p40 [Orgyia leucostigma nucleopolyhedrovirus]